MKIRDFLSSLKKVLEEGEPTVVERHSKPVGVFVPLSERVRENYPELWKELQVFLLLRRVEESGLSPEEIVAKLRRRLKNGKEKGGEE